MQPQAEPFGRLSHFRPFRPTAEDVDFGKKCPVRTLSTRLAQPCHNVVTLTKTVLLGQFICRLSTNALSVLQNLCYRTAFVAER